MGVSNMMNRTMLMEELKVRGYEVEPYEKVNNGVVLNGIIVKVGEISPIIYVESYIEEAKEFDLTVAEVVDKMEEIIKSKLPTFNVDELTDSQFVLERVFIGVQKASDEDILKRESELEGIETYLYVQICNEGSFKVRRNHLPSYKLTEEELWERAEENTRKETVIRSMASIMRDMGYYVDEEELGFYVVSNRSKERGASNVFDKKALEDLAQKLKVKGFAILPSSIHEMLLIPFHDEDEVDMKMLNEMVWSVNHTQVLPEERLTDRAYMFQF